MCNFSGMIKNVLPSLRQRAGPQRAGSRQKSIRSGGSFSQTPHMRGKDDEGRLKLRHVGITPAYAGKRRSRCRQSSTRRDHPRMCEEKAFVESGIACGRGSPPHVRGKVLVTDRAGDIRRITPAYAGKRCSGSRRTGWPKDHPRTCGEKPHHSAAALSRSGSPPHVRGKVQIGHLIKVCLRITPACAGKRCSGSRRTGWPKDHPRMCGEKTRYRRSALVTVGSPPHVRGKDLIPALCCVVPGITPACAGKSQGLNIFHTKRSSGPSPAAVPAGPAGSCPASRPSQFPPRMTVISPRP